jgi:hypothetical protein
MKTKILSKEEYKKKLTEMLKKDKEKYAKFGIDLGELWKDIKKSIKK